MPANAQRLPTQRTVSLEVLQDDHLCPYLHLVQVAQSQLLHRPAVELQNTMRTLATGTLTAETLAAGTLAAGTLEHGTHLEKDHRNHACDTDDTSIIIAARVINSLLSG